MKFDFKFGFKKEAKAGKHDNFNLVSFWQKISKIVFSIFLGAIIFLSIFVWQKSLSGGGWSEEKKQEYLNSQSKSVFLKENDFEKATKDVEARRQGAIKKDQPRDIFK